MRGISTPELRQTPNGEKLVYHGVFIDITDQRESEWEARRRADAMAMAADGMAILDDEGEYVSVNQAHAEIYGYDTADSMVEPSEVERLFEAFEQESEGLGREYEGTGLGLSIVQELAKQMGGTIRVESEKGEGSRFVLQLPKAEGG